MYLNTFRKKVIAVIAVLFFLVIFLQIIHMAEHFSQILVWIFGERSHPYMTPWGMWAMDRVGQAFFPNEFVTRQKMLGFEMLHLLANALFLLGAVGLYFLLKTRAFKWTALVQGFHVYEHIMLTTTAYFLNK